MQKVSSSELRPGMVTAEDVFTYTGKLLIQKGAVLTDNAITKLEFYSILQVRIEDPVDVPEEPKEKSQESAIGSNSFEAELLAEFFDNASKEVVYDTYSKKIKASPEFLKFKEVYDHELPKFKKILEYTAKNRVQLKMDVLNAFAINIMGDNQLQLFDMLHNLREYDDATYVHCINVALMCNAFAKWLHMSDADVEMATICGLLHDIGKIAVPNEILLKPSTLTTDEYSIVKRHSYEGFNILKTQPLPDHVKNAALMHHERNDGSGYPLGITGDKIDRFASMVAIVDVYDAMTSARCYRGPLCPFKVIAIFESEGLTKYNTQYIMTFLENIVNTYMFNTVRLSDGRQGEIVYINKSCLSKPTIKIGDDYVNLSLTSGIYIEEIL